MRYRRRSLLPRLLLWLIVLGGIGFVGLRWGSQGLAWVNANLLAGHSTPAPVRQSETAPLESAPTQQAGQPVTNRETELAPDGFPLRSRRHVLRYTVQPGDALFLIADRFGLDPNTIFWANTETLQDNVHLLHVGVELYILPVDGVYHRSDGTQTIAEIAAQYGVTPGDILYSEFNDLADKDSSYVPPAGLHIVVPGGRRQYASWASPIRTGSRGGANPEGLLHPGSCRELYAGPGGTGEYQNPLGDVPYRVTNGFAPWHPGVDMAANANTPVYAADTGVVVFAGWHRDGYGELIILDHGNGWTTYYGHLATRFVGCGDQVSRGQLIGQMGMTGNATGIHLHFEIREDDVPQNPYLYIPIQDIRSSGG